MKHLMTLLTIPFLFFFSCSQQVEEEWNPDRPNLPETHPVGVRFSQASLEAFAEQGITEIEIYAYLKDSMVYGKTLPLKDGNLQVDLPLGENLQTFAVANADHLTDADSLSKVVVYQDALARKQVYISEIVSFTSDKSVNNLGLELKRLVGQAVFQPKETEEEMNTITQFDQLNVTFTKVGVVYKVKTGVSVQEDVTIRVDRAAGFSASVYSFPTVSGDSRTSVDVVYLKDGVEVNRTNSPLDTGIAFEASKRSTVYMKITDENYLEESWPLARKTAYKGAFTQPFTIEVTDF